MINKELIKVMRCFPGSFVNANREVIVHEKANAYFRFDFESAENDLKAKLLEWLSRDAHSAQPFKTAIKNEELHRFILRGINTYLCTTFSKDDITLIYGELGNGINHKLTLDFIESGYDLKILWEVMNEKYIR